MGLFRFTLRMVLTIATGVKVNAEIGVPNRSHPLVVGGRVNEKQQAKIDAAAMLRGVPRSQFVAGAAVEKAEEVLRCAVMDSSELPA